MLNIFFLLVTNLALEGRERYILLVFLIFAVTEGRVGLSLLISLTRSHGRDHLKRFNLL
jgi:NADH:ubiquinone oxidoreductase subunit K